MLKNIKIRKILMNTSYKIQILKSIENNKRKSYFFLFMLLQYIDHFTNINDINVIKNKF